MTFPDYLDWLTRANKKLFAADKPGWREVAWKAAGGYGSQANARGRANSKRERLYFSPACLVETQDLFTA